MRNTSTIPQNIFIYEYSHGGSSFEQLICLDTTIVSLFFKKSKKKKKSKRRRNNKKRERERERERERKEIKKKKERKRKRTRRHT